MSKNFKLHKLLANVQHGSIIGVQAVLSDGTKSPVFGEGACKIESDTLSSHGASEISIKQSPGLGVLSIKQSVSGSKSDEHHERTILDV